jgi:hypothetical protein
MDTGKAYKIITNNATTFSSTEGSIITLDLNTDMSQSIHFSGMSSPCPMRNYEGIDSMITLSLWDEKFMESKNEGPIVHSSCGCLIV